MRRHLLIPCFLLFAAPAFAQTVEVLKVDYVRTRTDAASGTTSTLEEGTYRIAPDGVFRIDRLNKATGTRSATIEGHEQRTTLDVERREARTEANTTVPGGMPSAWQSVGGTQRTDLGTKQVGGVTLRGYRFTSVLASPRRGQIVHHNEVWSYMPADPKIIPVMLELRFESPVGVEEQKVVAVEKVTASKDIFRVPKTFTTVK
jgi:hypothetical protein